MKKDELKIYYRRAINGVTTVKYENQLFKFLNVHFNIKKLELRETYDFVLR